MVYARMFALRSEGLLSSRYASKQLPRVRGGAFSQSFVPFFPFTRTSHRMSENLVDHVTGPTGFCWPRSRYWHHRAHLILVSATSLLMPRRDRFRAGIGQLLLTFLPLFIYWALAAAFATPITLIVAAFLAGLLNSCIVFAAFAPSYHRRNALRLADLPRGRAPLSCSLPAGIADGTAEMGCSHPGVRKSWLMAPHLGSSWTDPFFGTPDASFL